VENGERTVHWDDEHQKSNDVQVGTETEMKVNEEVQRRSNKTQKSRENGRNIGFTSKGEKVR